VLNNWDSQAADNAAVEFATDLKDLELEHPEAIKALRNLWSVYYMAAGHKRLARVLLRGEA